MLRPCGASWVNKESKVRNWTRPALGRLRLARPVKLPTRAARDTDSHSVRPGRGPVLASIGRHSLHPGVARRLVPGPEFRHLSHERPLNANLTRRFVMLPAISMNCNSSSKSNLIAKGSSVIFLESCSASRMAAGDDTGKHLRNSRPIRSNLNVESASLQTNILTTNHMTSVNPHVDSLPPAHEKLKQSQRTETGSTPILFLPIRQAPPMRFSDTMLTTREARRRSPGRFSSPKSSRRSAPTTPRNRPFAVNELDLPQKYRPPHRVTNSTIFTDSETISSSTSSSCLSSSDTSRPHKAIGGTCSSPATPRGKSGGSISDSAEQGASSGENVEGIACALRGKLERALSASLSEVNCACVHRILDIAVTVHTSRPSCHGAMSESLQRDFRVVAASRPSC